MRDTGGIDRRMFFVGLDLAWKSRNRTGVAVIDNNDKLVRMTSATTDDEIVDVIRPFIGEECLVAIDAPLVVPNEHGYRVAETLLNRHFKPFDAIAMPSNKNTEGGVFDPPRGAVLVDRLGLDMNPWSTSKRRAIEVYPHPALVSLFALGRILKYKRRNKNRAHRQAEMSRLIRCLERLERLDPPLRLDEHPDWVQYRSMARAATRPIEMNTCEDPLDGLVCAYIALYATRRPQDTTTYGDFENGYIITPALSGGLIPTPRDAPPGFVPSQRPDHERQNLTTQLADAEAQLADLNARIESIRRQIDSPE